jgi:hypothetical protein
MDCRKSQRMVRQTRHFGRRQLYSKYSINQLEMWQADTFDPTTIDRELGWAESIGMNVMRVYLHDLVYQENKEGFLKRMDDFLKIADKHHIKILFVFFDSCWNDDPKLGKQPDPKPGVHNSGWARSPAQRCCLIQENGDVWRNM